MFNSVSWQCHEVWPLQFPFLHSLRYVIPPSETCLCGHINWSQAQVQQQSSMGWSQSFPSKRVARPGHRLGSISQSRRDLCQGLVVHLWLKGLIWRVGMRLIPVARSLFVAVSSPVLLILGGKWAMGVCTPNMSQFSASSSSLSAVFQIGMLFNFSYQWRSITSNRFVLNMVWGHHLQLRYHPPCSITSNSSMSKWLWLIIPLYRRWMSCLLRE